MTEWAKQIAPSLAPETARRYATSFAALEGLLAHRYLDQMDRRFFAQIASRRGVTNATKRRDLTAISSVLRACVGWGWIEHNAALDYDRSLIRERRDPIRLPDPMEVEAFASSLDPSLRTAVLLLRHTGMRTEEVATLQRRQIDRQRRAIQLTETKSGRARSVPLSDSAISVLDDAVPNVATTYIVWREHRGVAGPYSDLSKVLMDHRRAAGIRWTTHHLRHLFAVEYLRNGGSIYRLQQVLGHGSIGVTEIYLDYLSPDEQLVAKELVRG